MPGTRHQGTAVPEPTRAGSGVCCKSDLPPNQAPGIRYTSVNSNTTATRNLYSSTADGVPSILPILLYVYSK